MPTGLSFSELYIREGKLIGYKSGGLQMKILHILNDGPDKLPESIISVHERDNEVKIIDLSKKDISYDSIVDDIFTSDKVISW